MAGLACVVATALLSAASVKLVELTVTEIQNASPSAFLAQVDSPTSLIEQDTAERLAEKVSVPVTEMRQALAEVTGVEKNVDEAFRREAVTRLGWLSLAVVGLFGIKYWFTRGQTYYLTKAAAELSADLQKRIFAKLQRLPISYYNKTRTGRLHSILTNDVNVFENAIYIVRDSIDGPIKAIAAFVIIITLQWQLAFVSMVFLPIVFVLIQRNGRKMKAATAQLQENLAEVGALTQEALQGARVIKSFNAERAVERTYRTFVDRALGSRLYAARRIATLRPMVELIGASALAAVLYVCGWLAFDAQLDVAKIAALIVAMDLINNGFRTYGYVNATYNQVQAAADRIYSEVLDAPEERPADAGDGVIVRPKGEVTFDNVGFTYPDGTIALRGVSFTLPAGQSLALVGPSGAGKSTIADLLLRFYDPTEGRILIDGVDVRTLSIEFVRGMIGVVPQQTFLFAQSIAENIRLGKPDATDEEVIEASRMAHALPFVERMPLQFEEKLGERGARLSGGEMQRIAIARALVCQPQILLLDEATSNLDAESEKAVQSALDDVMRTRTTLMIAHRLTTASRADQILVLSRGLVIECGSHSELMSKNGAYAAMFRAYSSGVLSDAVE